MDRPVPDFTTSADTRSMTQEQRTRLEEMACFLQAELNKTPPDAEQHTKEK